MRVVGFVNTFDNVITHFYWVISATVITTRAVCVRTDCVSGDLHILLWNFIALFENVLLLLKQEKLAATSCHQRGKNSIPFHWSCARFFYSNKLIQLFELGFLLCSWKIKFSETAANRTLMRCFVQLYITLVLH